MHTSITPNSLWCLPFPQGLAGVPGQPGEPGKEGKRVSKHKQSTSCVAWLLVVQTTRMWPNSSWVAFVVLGEVNIICGPELRGGVGLFICQWMNRLHSQGVKHSQYDWPRKWLSPAEWLWWTVFSFLRGQLDLGFLFFLVQCLWLNELKHYTTFIYLSDFINCSSEFKFKIPKLLYIKTHYREQINKKNLIHACIITLTMCEHVNVM